MAIDSASKRRGVSGVGFWVVGPAVTPDAARGLGWRQSSAWGYLGIAAGAPPVSSGQSPRASRYRAGHRVDYWHPLALLAVWLGRVWA